MLTRSSFLGRGQKHKRKNFAPQKTKPKLHPARSARTPYLMVKPGEKTVMSDDHLLLSQVGKSRADDVVTMAPAVGSSASGGGDDGGRLSPASSAPSADAQVGATPPPTSSPASAAQATAPTPLPRRKKPRVKRRYGHFFGCKELACAGKVLDTVALRPHHPPGISPSQLLCSIFCHHFAPLVLRVFGSCFYSPALLMPMLFRFVFLCVLPSLHLPAACKDFFMARVKQERELAVRNPFAAGPGSLGLAAPMAPRGGREIPARNRAAHRRFVACLLCGMSRLKVGLGSGNRVRGGPSKCFCCFWFFPGLRCVTAASRCALFTCH